MMPMSSDAGSGMKVRALGPALLGLLLLLGGLSRAVPAEEAPPKAGSWPPTRSISPASIWASFAIDARFEGSAYELKGEGRFSLFLGRTYKSSGSAESSGRFTSGGFKPSSFKLSIKNGDKKEARRMSFARGAVSQVTFNPQKKVGRHRVPVTQDQLADVLDPLSAAFLHTSSGNSCAMTP